MRPASHISGEKVTQLAASETRAESAVGTDSVSQAATAARSASTSRRLLVGLSAGHAVKHFYQQGIIVLLPHLKEGLGISDVAVGGIEGARSAAMGAMNVPAGILTDMYRRQVGLMLTASMACLTVGYMAIGLAPYYWLVLVAVTIAGAGTSLWHAPAFSTLATKYPHQKAFAFAAHRSGGSIGDTSGPIIVGLLLGGISFWGLNWSGFGWKTVALLHAGPAAITGLAVLYAFRSPQEGQTKRPTFGQYLKATGPLLRNTAVLGMVVVSALRGMAHRSFAVFLVIHMKENLGYSDLSIGLHVGLLTFLGILAGPVFGMISDRTGRRGVMVLGMAAITAILFNFLWADSGVWLTVMIGLLGIFVFSINSVMTAAAMDAIEPGTEGSAVAMLFTGGAIIGASAPVIAGLIYSNLDFEGLVIYAGVIAAIGAFFAAVVPIRKVLSSGPGP